MINIRKAILTALVLAGSVLCFGCNAVDESKQNGTNADGNGATVNDNHEMVVKCGDIAIELNGDFASVKDLLGEAISYSESKSCLYEGYDKTYTYEDVIIITYPIDGNEKIASITILSDEVNHNIKASIGDTLEELKSYYGEDKMTITENCCIIEDEWGIALYMKDNIVTEIEIYIL